MAIFYTSFLSKVQENRIFALFWERVAERIWVVKVFMKIENVVIGLLILMFAIILAVDAVLVTWGQAGIPLSGNDVKGITGTIGILAAIFILLKARK